VSWLFIGSIIPSFLIAWLLSYAMRRYARGWGLVDLRSNEPPRSDREGRGPIPTGGGIAIWAAVVLPLAAGTVLLGFLPAHLTTPQSGELGSLWNFVGPHLAGLERQSGKLWILLGCGTLLMLLGLFDDRYNLDWRLRILFQTLVACLMVWQGWQLSFFVDLPLVTAAASIVWIVGLINTFNMLDNMDGLAAGVAAIVVGILTAVILTAPHSIRNGPQLFVAGLLLVLFGALLGFLWHNVPPAKLFMGDAGSYFIGFCIATATISATFAGEGLPRHAILAPLCVLAIPIYDTLTVIWIRCREGRSPFAGDTSHISHRLVDLGLSRRGAVTLLYLATAASGLGAFSLHLVNTQGAILVLLGIGGLLWLVATLELTARRRRQQRPTEPSEQQPE